MSKFNVWVTLLTESDADRIVSGLARRQFSVGASDGNFLTIHGATNENLPVCYTLGLTLTYLGTKNKPSVSASEVCDIVWDVIETKKIKVFSLVVVAAGTEGSWRPGNIVMTPSKKKSSFERLKESDNEK